MEYDNGRYHGKVITADKQDVSDLSCTQGDLAQ